jgi:hypothetical protein
MISIPSGRNVLLGRPELLVLVSARIFHDAGLPWPRLKSFQYAAAGPEGPTWYYVDLLRTVLPHVERLGLATAEQVDIETLADRLRAEAKAEKITAFLPRWVGGWVRVP